MAGYDSLLSFGRFVELVHPMLRSAGITTTAPGPARAVEVAHVRVREPGAGSVIPGSVRTVQSTSPSPAEARAELAAHFRRTFPYADPLPLEDLAPVGVLLDGTPVAACDAVVQAERAAVAFLADEAIVTAVIGLRLGDHEPLAFRTSDPAVLLGHRPATPPGA